MSEWKNIDLADCPDCGSSVQVFTSAIDGYCHDGDAVRCMDCEFRGGVSVDVETGEAWVQEP